MRESADEPQAYLRSRPALGTPARSATNMGDPRHRPWPHPEPPATTPASGPFRLNPTYVPRPGSAAVNPLCPLSPGSVVAGVGHGVQRTEVPGSLEISRGGFSFQS